MKLTVENVKLRGRRLLVSKPTALIGSEIRKIEGSKLFAPGASTESRRGWGLKATVLKAGPGIVEEIPVGSTILVDELAGLPLWDDDTESHLWLVGEGEVMAVIDGPAC